MIFVNLVKIENRVLKGSRSYKKSVELGIRKNIDEDHAKVRQQRDRRVHRRLRAAPHRRRAREERRRLADERLGAPDSLDSLEEAAHLRGHKPVPLYFF